MLSALSNFSHIYVEESANDFAVTDSILSKFPRAERIEIKNYKEVFARSRQDWRLQKKSIKLILATKENDFLYKGSAVTPNFGFVNFYYNTLIMNCLYDCHYCYLQGMYPTANMVVFVNLENYFEAVDKELADKGLIYVCISYDTDLLALEGIVPYCRQWIKFASERPDLTIEIRTKSANFRAIEDLPAQSNVVLAWTLSPQSVAEKYETSTPSLKARLNSVSKALNNGWPVRICFDPVLKIDNWTEVYQQFLNEVFCNLPGEKLKDLSVGTFRMNTTYFDRIQKSRLDSDLLHFPYERRNGMVSHSPEALSEIHSFMFTQLEKYIPMQKVSFI